MNSKMKLHLVALMSLAVLKVVYSAPDGTDSADSEVTQGRLYRWIAIGCGAVINIIIGGYAGMTNILEMEGRWTQRLEFVKDEYKWWTAMSSIVLLAFAMDVMAFSKGESVDATILLLAAEVGIVVFLYVVQGTLHAEFRQVLWLAWSGSSRTGCDLPDGAKLGELLGEGRGLNLKTGKIKFESNVDIPGYGAVFSPKIKQDLTTVLKRRSPTGRKTAPEVFGYIKLHRSARKYVFPQHRDNQVKVSILWGGGNCELFSRRASRGITGYTLERIRSAFSLTNVDEMKWMFVAGGIVARNKGLYPARLVCGLVTETVGTDGITVATPNTMMMDEVETASKWRPRPAKTSKGQYAKEAEAQFSGLGKRYCAAVVEMALLLQDVPNRVLIKALEANVEQQSSEKMWEIHDHIDSLELQDAMYVCQYMTFCAKLNWYGDNNERPDLLMGMMYATLMNWNYSITGNEDVVSRILWREIEGLDLATEDDEKTDYDILFCLAAYLGINKDDRKRVITAMSTKFSPNAAIQQIFHEEIMPPQIAPAAVHLQM